ncbi:hypothetical protein EZ456_07705 [Pedobacter psychrodurus]|uniref:Uncharacterized protein n=1 Tax=Pedobacter psychrodurus TaxID=2530456 RepID=A0A4R0PXY6_9SPHI|nr:hypothetical protein [Pedobacter psychrodurus]TCD27824.1 hypothetical protein EZ456_07705 [Pedobacter psychrodurus]
MGVKPIYELLIDARGCYFELLINDIPFYFHYKVGATSFRLPVNNFIPKSGKQSITLKMLSINEGDGFPVGAEVVLKMEEFEKNTPKERKAVMDYKTPDLKTYTTGVFTDKKIFNADVPYTLSYVDSIDLSKIDHSILRETLEKEYIKYTNAFKKNDLSAYQELTSERQENIFTSLYVDSEKRKKQEASYLSGVTHNLVKLYPLKSYRLVFYNNNKFVGLQMLNEAPGIYIDNEKEEDAFIEYILFRKKTSGSPISIVL